VRPYKPVGCLECRKTGYRGRVGLYELLVMSEAARLRCTPRSTRTRCAARPSPDGMRPLRLAGVMKVAEGVTTLDEVLRTTPAWEGLTAPG
jgi:general secretion pathway protein E